MRLEIENHLLKEERMLFPYIALMESSLNFGQPIPPAPFGSTRNPVKVMVEEHDAAGEHLREIRKLSNHFAVPEDACITYQTLYGALEEFERDLHQHIHLENNILFPKAIEMEAGGKPADANRMDEVKCGLHGKQSDAGSRRVKSKNAAHFLNISIAGWRFFTKRLTKLLPEKQPII